MAVFDELFADEINARIRRRLTGRALETKLTSSLPKIRATTEASAGSAAAWQAPRPSI